MSTYLEKISAAQEGIDSFYRLLNIYKFSKLNNGWKGTEEIPSNINLGKFNTFFDDNKFKKLNDSVDATLFDIPMSSRGYDKYGKYGAGIPSDIGFTRNVTCTDTIDERLYRTHLPLYKVCDENSLSGINSLMDVTASASNGANTDNGGIVRYELNHGDGNPSDHINSITVYPNNSNPFTLKNSECPWNNYKYVFTITQNDDANHLHMLYCFLQASLSDIGLRLYITTDFITWKTHQIIPSNIDYEIWNDLTNLVDKTYMEMGDTSEVYDTILKYFRVLPNNNYLIMEPVQMYNGTDKTTMVKMYSPYNDEPLMTIKDFYGTDEYYKEKAIGGFSAFMTENGEIVLYYNDRPETPMVIYNGRTMGTFEGNVSTNYAQEIIESPKVAKIYDAPISSSLPYNVSVDNMVMDCAVNILESKNGNLTNEDIPAASVNLALGDIGKPFEDKMDDSVSLYVDSSIDMMDNIDVDFSSYINGKNISGKEYLSGNYNVEQDSTNVWTTEYRHEELTDICYGNGIFVAVQYGSDNTGLYSIDGMTWTECTISAYTATGNRYICYGNGIFVSVVNGSDLFSYSTDGITWTDTRVSSDYPWHGIYYAGSKFFAVGHRGLPNVRIVYSTDGINWETALPTNCPYDICYANNRFLALSPSSIILYSTDGITWTEEDETDDLTWHALCYGDGKFVVLGDKHFKYSIDGINWEIVPVNNSMILNNDIVWGSICYADNKFIGIGYNDYSDNCFGIYTYSYDGIDWEFSTMPTSGYWSEMCYGDGKIVCIVDDRPGIESAEVVDDVIASICSSDIQRASQKINISDNSKLTITSNPSIGITCYNPNVRYRATIFGNTIVSNKVLAAKELSTGATTLIYWNAICYGNEMYVAFGGSTFAYSKDGLTWNISKCDGVNIFELYYSNGIFVGVGYGRAFVYSTDGMNWTTVTISETNRKWNAICYGDGKFIAINGEECVVACSIDGISWTEHQMDNVTMELEAICFSEQKKLFVAVGPGIIASSGDGINWQSITFNKIRYWGAVCYGNDKFVAITDLELTNTIIYSYDGMEWFETKISSSPRYWQTIYYGNGMFIAIAGGTTFAYSIDGIKWYEGEISTTNRQWYTICYGNGKFIALPYNNGSDKFAVITDEIHPSKLVNNPSLSWAFHPIDTINYSTSPNWNSVCYGDGKFVAIKDLANDGLYSTDGINWTVVDIISSDNHYLQSICYGDGKFVAVTRAAGICAYSTDGIVWTEVNIPSHNATGYAQPEWYSVCYGDGMFITVARESSGGSWYTGSFAYSTDGINWTEGNIGSNYSGWGSVCYGDGKFVAMSCKNYYNQDTYTNTYAYSTDGLTWTEGALGDNLSERTSICYGNGKFIAVGNSNIAIYSIDGIEWVEVTISATERDWRSVCYGDGKYVAVAYDSNIFAYSYDGINWIESTINSARNKWSAICYGDRKFVIVGYNDYGTFAYSKTVY